MSSNDLYQPIRHDPTIPRPVDKVQGGEVCKVVYLRRTMNLIDIEIEKVGKEEKIDWQYQKGPCKVCGTTNYPLSCGGPDVCPACDCYAPCPRCKILIKENELLRSSLQRVISETKKKCIEALPKTRSCLDCSSQYECGCDSFNQAIQQSKQNIEEVR